MGFSTGFASSTTLRVGLLNNPKVRHARAVKRWHEADCYRVMAVVKGEYGVPTLINQNITKPPFKSLKRAIAALAKHPQGWVETVAGKPVHSKGFDEVDVFLNQEAA